MFPLRVLFYFYKLRFLRGKGTKLTQSNATDLIVFLTQGPKVVAVLAWRHGSSKFSLQL